MLKANKHKAFGLDIGTSAIKMIMLEKANDRYTVTEAGFLNIDETIGQEESNLGRTVRECVHASGTSSRLAVCSVSGSEVAVRNFSFPELSQPEIEGAMKLEASQVCPFNIDKSTIDYQLLLSDKNEIRGFLVAATDKQIEGRKNIVKAASLDAFLIDVDGLALINCLYEVEKPDGSDSLAVLNVGNTYTNFAIIGNDSMPFVRDIPYAAKDITQYIAEEKGISGNKVSELLFGDNDSSNMEFVLGDSFENACGQLIDEILGTIRHYRTHTKAKAIETIRICGGFANTNGFVKILNDKLPVEAVIWNPFEKMNCDLDEAGNDMLKENGPAMAVAAGLAMRAL
ncbi:MAG: type IV pilus assembly protein PilM [Sedimentisphaerales bacterium]|nr:type IV pilus assembly protein PilM [Sedimentisphaerales bacterium]